MAHTDIRDMILRPTAFEVASESKAGVTYRVQLPDCECPDFRYRRTHPSGPSGMFCKHLRAAFGMAGWQLPVDRDTSRLDEEAAIELLVDLGCTSRAADSALRRSIVNPQGTITLPGGSIVVILFDRRNSVYDVRLPR